MSKISTIAASVTALLLAGSEDGTLPGGFTPVQRWTPKAFLPAELQQLQVSVVPRSHASEIAARGVAQNSLVVDVGVQKKLGNVDEAAKAEEIEGLVSLCEKIRSRLLGHSQTIEGLGHVVFYEVTVTPVVSVDAVEEDEIFASVVSVTARVATDIGS